MTGENRKPNIADELARAEQALRAARALLPSSHNRLLAGIQRSRELADYDAAVEFSDVDAEGCRNTLVSSSRLDVRVLACSS